MKKILLSCACLMPAMAFAQLTISDVTNNGSVATDFSNAETVITAPSGIGYQAMNGGVFHHNGPAAATLTVNGVYDAFSLTPGNPGVDNFNGLDSTGSALVAGTVGAGTTVEIAGNTAPLFGTVNFKNGSGRAVNITNTQGVTIGNFMGMNSGVVNTTRSSSYPAGVHFFDGASYSLATVGDYVHVNGYVDKTGNDPFLYPVGDGTLWRGVQLQTAPASVTDRYGVAWLPGNPTTTGDPSNANALHPVTSVDMAGGIMAVSTIGQWDWVPVSGTGAGLTVQVAIRGDVSTFTSSASTLRLVGWDGTKWVNLSTATGSSSASGLPTSTAQGSGWQTLTGVMQAGIFAIGIGSTTWALPLELTSFTGRSESCRTMLEWATAREVNFSHFDVQYSTNGNSYTTVGKVNSKGSRIGSEYSFVHTPAPGEKSFYRLQMVDIDGSYNYSNTVSVSNSCDVQHVVVYPNPTKNIVTITGLKEQLQLQVYDITGKLVIGRVATGNTAIIDFAAYADGMYQLIIMNGAERLFSTKIIKQQ